LPKAVSSDNELTITLTVTDEEDTLATCTAIPGPTTHAVVDLDAGTTLPRAISIGATALLVAGFVATLFGGQPAQTEPTQELLLPRIAPQAIILPAWQTRWSVPHDDPGPAWPVGPSALVNASAGAATIVGIGQ
jgi:hypothetical protein